MALLGISSGLAHTDARDWAAKQKALGCGAVVFPVDHTAGRAVIAAYAEAAQEAGLVIAEVGVWRNVIDRDEKKRAEARAYAVGQLEMAEEIGARCCVNVAGACVGSRWDGAYRENFETEAWERTVESVQAIIDAVQPTRTFYTLEPMPWMIPSGPREYLRLLTDIDRKQAGVHLDIVNMINCPERFFFQEKFMEECFSLLAGRICSCHLKDIRLRDEFTFQLEETACGKGRLNLERYAALATAERADMPLLIEHLDSDAAYIESLRYVQKRLGGGEA